MQIINQPMQWYIDRIEDGIHFSMGMYGDGEWQAIFNFVFNSRFRENCELTQYTPALCKAMFESLKFKPGNFLFSVPDTFNKVPEYHSYSQKIDNIVEGYNLPGMFFEKNIWNKMMGEGLLYPLIKAFRKHNLVIIGNKNLRDLTFLKYDHFVEVGYPNAYEDMERAVKECLDYGKPGIYLFACGIPAALFVQKLHGKIPNSWFLDLGSIWDGFVGIGGQRPTRRELYLHPETWVEWVKSNLREIKWDLFEKMRKKGPPKVKWYGMGSLDINPNL